MLTNKYSMGEKGFVLMETLAICSVIIVLLTVCYYPFSSAIYNNERYEKYDTIENIYKLNNVRQYIYKYIRVNNILADNDDKKIIPIYNHLTIEDNKIIENYHNLLNVLGIKTLYLVNYNLSGTDIDNVSSLSYEFKEYLKYINNSVAEVQNEDGTTREIKNTYRLVARFNDGTYSNIKIWRENNLKTKK